MSCEVRCPRCAKTLPCSAFYRSSTQSSGYQSYCKVCSVQHQRQNKGRRKFYQIKSDYGLSKEDYERFVEENLGACPICQNPPGKKGWVVDHDHVTGKVRGLICQACNVGIGVFHDDPEIMERAAAYLKEHTKEDSK